MSTLTADENMLDISMMSAEYGDREFTDALVELANKNIPMEIITRLEGLLAPPKTRSYLPQIKFKKTRQSDGYF